ncbi:hypothetical protein N7466_003642 [Penicillium verhagenii]|uniref:uncharacterized protein n=1 Tax=Penicillium verhagenii TaxID=1562060 RepID=UPI00254542D2|nr:uncharacterized protein N7466_003642 [Penicillium verhagenii]KAJ5934095.1 hypothetical protein N7466_003642 [Penicillium verhagenii]
MSIEPIKNVAIVGASGRIGGAFAKALSATGKHNVTVLVRKESKATLPEGVHVIRVDYNDEDSIINALNGQQFLAITLGVRAPEDLHAKITTAAGKAGVTYIMPNAYGYPANPDSDDVYGKAVLTRLNDANNGVSSGVTLSCGFWYEWSLASGEQWFGFTIKDRKVTFFDDGKRTLTVSTWDQCGRAFAAFLSLPETGHSPCVRDFKDVPIYSFQVSQRDMLDSLHRVLGTKDSDWEIKYEPVSQRIKDGAEEFAKGIFTGFAKMLYGGVFQVDNSQSDYASTLSVANETLGLPKEDLDEATKRTVEMVEGGWNPFGNMG